MADFTAHNRKVLKIGLKHAESEIKAQLESVLREVAQKLVDTIDGAFSPVTPKGGNQQFPVWQGHLHDATGVGVYVDGRLSSYLPTKKGVGKQTASGIKGIDGSDYLQNALNGAVSEYSKGIWIVLFSAVPYAYMINKEGSSWGRGAGFFERIKSILIDDIFYGLRPIQEMNNPNSLGL